MADTIQFYLEKAVPQIQSLRERGVLSDDEAKALVARRRDFEYKVKTRQSPVEQWLRYIEYEESIFQLIRLRLRLKISKKANKKPVKNSKTARTIRLNQEKYIHSLYRRALRNHHELPSLWLKYVARCQQGRGGATRSASAAFVRALQLHPLNSTLWIRAAFWEYSRNLNVNAARAILQRGLRIIPGNESMWHAYFRMELLYWQKIKKRMELMGVDGAALVADTSRNPCIASSKLPGSENGQSEQRDSVAGDPSDPSDPNGTAVVSSKSNLFLECGVPRAVVRSACAKLPDSFDLRLGFLAIYMQFDGTATAQQELLDGIRQDFSNLPEMWALMAHVAVAQRAIATGDSASEERIAFAKGTNAGKRVFKEALETLSCLKDNAHMRELYASFFEKRRDHARVMFGEDCAEGVEMVKERLKVLQDAADSLAQEIGEDAGAQELAVTAFENLIDAEMSIDIPRDRSHPTVAEIAARATDAVPSSVSLWLIRIRLLASSLSDSEINNPKNKRQRASRIEWLKKLSALFSSAFDGVPREAAADLWVEYFRFCIAAQAPMRAVLKHFERAIFWDCEEASKMKMQVIEDIGEVQPIDVVRQFYEAALQVPPCDARLIRACLKVESSSNDLERQRHLLQLLVDGSGGDSADAWLKLYSLELQAGASDALERAALVQWSAMKRLGSHIDRCDLQQLFAKAAEESSRLDS